MLRSQIICNLIPKAVCMTAGTMGLSVVVTVSHCCGCGLFLLWFQSDCLKKKKKSIFNGNTDRTIFSQGFVFLSSSDNESSRGQNGNRRQQRSWRVGMDCGFFGTLEKGATILDMLPFGKSDSEAFLSLFALLKT